VPDKLDAYRAKRDFMKTAEPPPPGDEVEACASPFGKRAHAAVQDLKRIYGMDFDMHAFRRFKDSEPEANDNPASIRPASEELPL
jgi:hypothetical protein